MKANYLWLCVAGLLLGACGDGTNNNTDNTRAEGTEYKFVANRLLIPTRPQDYALDLNGDLSADNRLGLIIPALSAYFNVQAAVDAAVSGGQAIVLMGVQSTDPNLRSANLPGTKIYLGQPTTGAPDFSGSGTFTIDNRITPAQFYGRLQNGVFTANNPATTRNPVSVRINLPVAEGVNLNVTLNGASVRFNATTNGLTSGQINGSVKRSEIEQSIIPLVAQLLTQAIAAGGTAATQIQQLFDIGGCAGATANDGTIEVCEVQGNSIIQSALSPDVQIFAADGTTYDPCERPATECQADSLSLGIGFTAVRANF